MNDKIVTCIHCGSDCTHHRGVSVFMRNEDAEHGVHAVCDNMSVMVDNDITDNPSGRRDGLCIEIECENCLLKSTLKIWQHKGTTHITHE